ncbi:MAG: hypothetical protein ACOCXQ_02440 [Patescibacteria group bacterium]
MKNYKKHLKDILSWDSISAQLHGKSHVAKIFIFAVIGAVVITFFWQFFNQYITGTRAGTEQIAVTVSSSKDQVDLNEEFTVNVLLSAPGGKKVSQLDLRMEATAKEGAEISYVSKGYESSKLGGSEKDYFDTEIFEEYDNGKLRVVLSARKKSEELADKVLVKVAFKALKAGSVDFQLQSDNMEIVGPGGEGDPISYSVSSSSGVSTTVKIGQAEAVPTPTITLAPAPTCAKTKTLRDGTLVCDDTQLTSMKIRDKVNIN